MAAILVCSVFACAQTGTGGQGGGQGRGGQRGGFGQGRGGGGNNELTLAMRKDVQTDLGVSDEQKTKLTDLQAKLQPQRGQGGNRANRTNGTNGGAATGGAGGVGTGGAGTGGNGGAGAGAGGNRTNRGQGGQGGTFDAEAFRKRQEEQRATTHKALAEVLSADQLKRLAEISVQLQGNRAIMNPDIQKTLGITDEQKTKISDLQTKQQEANRALFEKVRNNELSQDDMRATTEKNNKTMGDELAKVLTSAQNAKLKEMGGKPFKADPNETQGRRGGGGGR